MTGEKLFNFLWDFGFTIIRMAGDLWIWLNTPIVPNYFYDGYKNAVEWVAHSNLPNILKVSIVSVATPLGETFIKNGVLNVTPIYIITTGMLIFIALGLVKTFVPKMS